MHKKQTIKYKNNNNNYDNNNNITEGRPVNSQP